MGREVFMVFPDGFGNSKVSLALTPQKLGVGVTTRNWRTVLAIAVMLQD